MSEDKSFTGQTVSERIDEILECGFRYAKYKISLAKNRIKEDPRNLTFDYLLKRLKEEVNELESALNSVADFNDLEDVAREAGDVINFAAMICNKTEDIGK
jgi:NTP pyrophosphatase (non-canonical NTP hydrolase)